MDDHGQEKMFIYLKGTSLNTRSLFKFNTMIINQYLLQYISDSGYLLIKIAQLMHLV